jgi:DNA-binding CsgD family transcriptional regulator
MKISDHDNKNLSEILIALHHGANVISPDKFREYALELVQTLIPFDSAVWGKHSRNGEKLVASEIYLHGNQTGLLQGLEKIRQLDTWLTEEQIVQPWITVNFNCSQPSRPINTELRRQFDVLGLMHCLCTTGYDPLTQSPHHIILSRKDLDRPYTEEERLLKQFLMPHLETACDHNYRLLPQTSSNNPLGAERRQSNALTNNQGILFATEPRFISLLQSEFPGWHGPLLPEPLLKTFIEENNDRYVGSTITLTASRRSSMWLLWARPKQPIDEFSTRTMKLAAYFAEGHNHKEIGQMMNISPATVRNHISIIYKKLQVSNKSQLAQLLSRARPPRMRR